jgi:glycosyltransferase involved in cell wall biosynthesis
MAPTFSIVIPLYNKAAAVTDTLRSVLAQTVTDFEVVVIDDGSTDNSAEVVEQFCQRQGDRRFQLLPQANAGVSATRNRGIELTQADHLIFLDADDLWQPTFLFHIQALISQFPQAGAYATAFVEQINDGHGGCSLSPHRIYGLKDQPVLVNNYFDVASRGQLPLMPSSTCIPRRILEEVGGFPTDQIQGEDQDLWARIGLRYPIALHPAPDVRYVISAENRVSTTVIPATELAFSRNLQNLLDHNQISPDKQAAVKRYIAGHLVHLAQLNIRNGNLAIANQLLSDPRCNTVRFRKWKWRLLSWFPPKNVKPRIIHLLNDQAMGGIRSVIQSLSDSFLANQYRFEFHCVSPQRLFFPRYTARMVMVHYAVNWRTLLGLLGLRLTNPGAKIVIQEHHYSPTFANKTPSPKRFQGMLRLNYALVDHVIAISTCQSQWLLERKILPAAKLTTIAQSRKLDDYLAVPPLIPHTPLVLGAYGRFCDQKGFDILLKAMKNLPQLTLQLAGRGEDEAKLRQLAQELDGVHFMGQVDNVPQFLASCDVIVIPSRYEPFGLVCLEALAAGRPVVVSAVDGLPEQLQGCGLVVPPDDEQALALALASLPKQPLTDWGKQAKANKTEDWQGYLQQYQRFFQQVSSAQR